MFLEGNLRYFWQVDCSKYRKYPFIFLEVVMKFGKLFGGGSKITRIMYGSDFHGSELVFRKFIAAAFQYKANVLMVGGDVTGKAMVPVVHLGGGKYEGFLFGRREEANNADELEKLKNHQ
jgi:hypothetical protein